MLARYPNIGYLNIDDTLNSTTIQCNMLNSLNWTGAAIHIRTARWTISTKRIAACDAGQKTLTINEAPYYGITPNWGFFINNKLEALDQAGEWYCDSITGKLYVWTPNGNSPAAYLVEGSIHQNGFDIAYGKSNVTIKGFSLFGHSKSGITANVCSNITIDGNAIFYPDVSGINFSDPACQNNTFTNNIIVGANHRGICTRGPKAIITNNTIKSIALIRHFTKSGLGDLGNHNISGVGIEALVDSAIYVSNNIVDSIGYIGIRTTGSHCRIEYNHVNNCCLSKDDGAGIYSGWQGDRVQTGSAGTIIRRNIVLNTRSAPEGTSNPNYQPGEGIYLDDRGHDVTISENTIAHCANHGIFIHNNKNTQILYNIVYNNRKQLGLAEDANAGSGYVANNNVKNNVLYSIIDKQICLQTTSLYTDTFLAITDSNYYCNPYNDIVIGYNSAVYTLDSWKSAKNLDAHSKTSLMQLPSYQITSILGPTLVKNGEFAASISQWSRWPASVGISWENNPELDSGCIKISNLSDTASLVQPATFRLTANQAYRLSFSVISNKNGTLQTIIRQAHPPWSVLGLSKTFIMTSRRQDFETVFYATATDTQCRVDFSNAKADSLYWLDNVSLVPVEAVPEDPQEKSKLFYNATMQDSSVSLAGRAYRDLDGNSVTGSITLAPFMAIILVQDTINFTASDDAEPTRTDNLRLTISPNPCNPAATISINAIQGQPVFVDCFDLRGRKVITLFNGTAPKSRFSLYWNGETSGSSKVGSGIYFIRFQSGESVTTHKLLLIR